MKTNKMFLAVRKLLKSSTYIRLTTSAKRMVDRFNRSLLRTAPMRLAEVV